MNIENFNPVAILNTGVTGFAFLMLYLGYRLMSDVQSKILEKDIGDFHDIKLFKEWKGLVNSQLTNTRYFLCFAALFFIGGLILLVYQAESKIIFSITPAETDYMPVIYHQSEQICLSKTGCKVINVKSEQNIRVSNDKIITELQKLRLDLETQKDAQKQFALKNATHSKESGFGF